VRGSHIVGGLELRLGEVLGPYRLVSVLGEGAIGVVYRATRDPDGTVVALKVLKPRLSRNEVYRQRFLREARVASDVRHAHLVPILDAGEARGHHYLAAAYVDGGSLADRIEAEGALPVADCVRFAAEIGTGLDALHAGGIVHRDVKPSNIMLDRNGGAALTDFGLAKGRAYTVLTKPGQVMGTLDYIAPELVVGGEAAPPTDIYALGCTVYEALTGTAPFAERRMLELAMAHVDESPPDPCGRRSELDPEVAAVVLEALAKDPGARPRTGTAFANLLRAAARLRR
jgi:serine/threonine protein kinase